MKKMFATKSGIAAALLLLLPIVGCGDEPMEPAPVPTTVTITPDMVELLSSGAQTGLNAVVRDQEGKAMPNATVTWTSSDPAVFTIEGNGLIATVTAIANGDATVTATAGQASGTAAVTVVQTPARMDVVSGNDQEAIRGTAVPQPLVVRVVELTGGVVPGVVINFAPADENSGSVSPAEVTTGADGTASAMWTLGDARHQRVTASVADPELVAGFRASATADPPEPDYTILGGTISRFDPLETETIDIHLDITNLGDGPSTGPFTVGYSVDAMEVATVQADPIEPGDTATVSVTIGPFEVGQRSIDMVVDPDNEFVEWDETNNEIRTFITVVQQGVIALGETLTLDGAGGSQQLFRVEVDEQVNQAFSVLLTGPSGDADVFVDYDTRPTSEFGHRCYSYNIGTDEDCELYPVRVGTYHILVDAFFAFEDAMLEVKAADPADPFDLELNLVNDGTASQNALITQVAERYASMIGVGAGDLALTGPAEACAPGMPELASHPIDDFAVWVMIGPLDGAGNAVAASGTCHVRTFISPWVGMPSAGAVVLDEADIGQLESDGVLEAVVTREMARALGFNPVIWNAHGFLQSPSLPEQPDADTHMNAPLVVAAFNEAGGADYAGAKVPLESGAMEAISDQYWRASVFGDEVMTPYLTGDSQPLSRITLEALYEVHVEIDVTMADAFTLSSARLARPRGPKRYYGIDLATYHGGVATMTAEGALKEKEEKK